MTEESDILPPHHWAAQHDNDDADSSLGSNSSSTASLSSSILNFRELNGRTFHSERGEAQYWAPNDQKSNETLGFLHHTLMLFWDGAIYQAPIKGKNIKKALDIGCGTGLWAIDFADEFPGCEIIGTEISPTQTSWVPPNVKFEIEDCTQTWTFADNSVDYVHIRWLIGSIKNWPALFKEAYRVLKPGGYIESEEPSDVIESADQSVKPTDALGQWHKLFRAGGKVIGHPFDVYDAKLQQKAIEEAGFEEIIVKDYILPIGSWPKDEKLKEVGQYAHLVFEHDTEGYIMFLANTLGWKREEILSYIAQTRREIRKPGCRAQYNQRLVWARKPL